VEKVSKRHVVSKDIMLSKPFRERKLDSSEDGNPENCATNNPRSGSSGIFSSKPESMSEWLNTALPVLDVL
jgi:hypothetical protein